MVIYCNLPEPGCVRTSFSFFDKAVAAGIVELIFEIPMMVRIYIAKKADKKEEEKKDNMP
jgi:hypothetical protein